MPEAGVGMLWADHLVPFHDSARGNSTPIEFEYTPTLSQVLAAVHATESSWAKLLPLSAGVERTVQDVPFHDSATVSMPAAPK